LEANVISDSFNYQNVEMRNWKRSLSGYSMLF